MTASLPPQELLQRIAENTTPMKTSMISITSTNPEFNVNFPSSIPVKEIALAKLRVYHSWPNIRSVAFGGQQPNNSLVFASKNKPNGEPDWHIVSIPTGSYQIEQINAELQRRIKSITGKESKIAITVHEPTLSSAIEILSPGYVVDIYNSSIRTVLGWPENPPRGETVDLPPELKKSDYISNKIKPDNPIKSYSEYTRLGFFAGVIERPGGGYHQANQDRITENFTAMNNDFSLLLVSLESGTLTKDEFISVVETCNKIIFDMEVFNEQIIQEVLDATNPKTRTEFAKKYNIPVEDILGFKLPEYNVPELKKKLSDIIDAGFKKKSTMNGRKKPNQNNHK
jgi:hypothetical protein